MNIINLQKGATGLEAIIEGEKPTVYHICFADEIGEVLDFIAEHFSSEWLEWLKEQDNLYSKEQENLYSGD